MRFPRLLAAVAAVAVAATGLTLATSASAASAVPEAWTNVGGTLPGTVYSLKRYRGTLYAGGAFGAGMARWDEAAGTWTMLGSGDRTVHVLEVGPDGTLYAGGEMTINGRGTPFVATWQGTDWKDIGVGSTSGPAPGSGWVSAISVDKSGALYAGGLFTDIGGAKASNLAVFDGKNWSAPQGVNVMMPVTALTVARGTLYVGAFLGVGASLGYGASFDGKSWSLLTGLDYTCPGLNPCLGIMDMAVDSSGILHAAGQFKIGTTLTGYATWNGRAWTAQPTGGMTIGTAITLGADDAVYASLGKAPGTAPFMVARMGAEIAVLGDLGAMVGTYSLVANDGTVYGAFTADPSRPTAPWQVAAFVLPAKVMASAVPRDLHFGPSHKGKLTLAWKDPAYQDPRSYRVQYRLAAGDAWRDVKVREGLRQAVLPASLAGKVVEVRVRADGGYWATRSLPAPAA